MSKIKSLREKFNMTQQDVSNESGVNIDTIRKWESGANDIKNANVSKVQAVADVFGVSIEELITDDEGE